MDRVWGIEHVGFALCTTEQQSGKRAEQGRGEIKEDPRISSSMGTVISSEQENKNLASLQGPGDGRGPFIARALDPGSASRRSRRNDRRAAGGWRGTGQPGCGLRRRPCGQFQPALSSKFFQNQPLEAPVLSLSLSSSSISSHVMIRIFHTTVYDRNRQVRFTRVNTKDKLPPTGLMS